MHLEALPKDGQDLFPSLRAFPEFYLAGGTALALQIGHRISEDFDLFSGNPLPDDMLVRAERAFAGKRVSPSVSTSDELTVLANGTKVTFLRYPFPVLHGFVHFNGMRAPTVAELAAMKAYTIGRRGSYRDYVDLYVVLKKGIADLRGIIALAEEKYGEGFNARLFLEQLAYFEDIRDTSIISLGESFTRGEVEAYFAAQIRQFPLASS